MIGFFEFHITHYLQLALINYHIGCHFKWTVIVITLSLHYIVIVNVITWAFISNAPKNAKTNLETSYIALWKPNLNEQKDFERLVLFRNGVTEQLTT